MLVTYFSKFSVAEWPPIREKAVHSVYRACFRKLLSVYILNYFPFGFEGRIWDLIVSVPDHAYLFTLVVVKRFYTIISVDPVDSFWFPSWLPRYTLIILIGGILAHCTITWASVVNNKHN